jgi:hypothetical protein
MKTLKSKLWLISRSHRQDHLVLQFLIDTWARSLPEYSFVEQFI